MQNKKDIIIQGLQQHIQDIQKQENTNNNNQFRIRAYQRVLNSISKLEGPVYSLEDLQEVKGIGPGIKKQITVFLSDDYEPPPQDETQIFYDLLTSIPGIGKKTAVKLQERGFTSIEILQENKEQLVDAVQLSLDYYKDLQQRIPKKEMNEHKAFIKEELQKVSKQIKFNIAGSYRRGAANSGDIDVLIYFNKTVPTQTQNQLFVDLIQHLLQIGYLKGLLTNGKQSVHGICKLGTKFLPRQNMARRIDFIITPNEQYPFALLYFTGSQQFNIASRQKAKQMGYTLSQLGLYDIKNKEYIQGLRTERDIFNFLELEYLKPSQR